MPGSRPLRIGVDARALVEPQGGLRRYLESILPPLYSLDTAVEWRLFLPRRVELETALLPPGKRLTLVPGSLQAWLRFPWEEWFLPRALAEHGIDVLFSPYGAVPRKAPPVVAMLHDLFFRARPETVAYGHRRYWNSVANRAHRGAVILTPSEAVRRDAIALLGLSSDAVITTPHGVSPIFCPEGARGLSGSRADGIETPYILTFGPWTSRKNLGTLEQATRALTDRTGRQVRLAVAGVTEAPGCESHVLFLGTLSDENLARAMRGALLSCVPSLHEGFGLPAIEAMACGSPVLVSDGGALPETGGQAAIVVKARDPLSWRAEIERLLSDPPERDRRSRAGVERSRLFTWEKAARVTHDAVMRAAAVTREA